jgi:hypothetical protein
MRYKTLFRILCKLMGVYFFLMGCNALISVASIRFQARSIGWTTEQGLLLMAGPLFELIAGAYLFFGGSNLANLAIPSNHPYCTECGYDLSESRGDVCPECGTNRRSGNKPE